MNNDKIPTSWANAYLNDVGQWGSGGTPSRRSAENYGGDIKWLKTGELGPKIVHETEEKISENGLNTSSAKIFEAGCIAIAMYGATIGKVSILGCDMATNQACAVISINDGVVDRNFLYHFLNSQKEAFANAGQGGAQPNISQKVIKEWPLPLPPKNEQRRIADKLDATLAAVEACKEKLQSAAETIQRFRQSVLAAAVSGELTREWREEVGIEEGWLQTTIDSIATVGTGSTPLRSNSSFYAKQGIPWVTSSATSEEFIESSEEFVTQAGIESARLKTYPIGTLLVAMYGEGKTRGQVSELQIEATINQACASIHSFKQNYLKEFTKLALKANYLNMRKLAEGGNQPNLNLKKIKTFPIGIPCREESIKISEIVNELFVHSKSIEERIEHALNATEDMSSSLLAKAFRGELVPQDPNDEPASVLLERIKAQREAKAAAKNPAKRGRKKKADAAQLVIPEGITDNHLTKVLQECGALSQRALLAASELEPAVFQLQLSRELEGGLIKKTSIDEFDLSAS